MNTYFLNGTIMMIDSIPRIRRETVYTSFVRTREISNQKNRGEIATFFV